jgi:hypothetical protein
VKRREGQENNVGLVSAITANDQRKYSCFFL